MSEEVSLPRALRQAIDRLLTAIFRVLLRHGMSYTEFDAVARRVYVDVALRDFGIPGKKPSISRASILSGLSRKEVQRLLSETSPLATPTSENRAVRVLTAWTRDADFVDAQGEPRVLSLQEGAVSFAELVRRHSGDMPARAVLDELVRVGAVHQHDDGSLQLLTTAFVPQGAADKIKALGSDVADLVDTIDHNITRGADDPRFQRRVVYHDMPVELIADFRRLSATRSMSLLVQLDRWLAERSPPEDPSDAKPGPRARLGLGIYYFEEITDPSKSKAKD